MTVSNFESLKTKTPINAQIECQEDKGEIINFQTLVENSQVMILIFQDRKICYANPMTKLLTGYNTDELLINTNLLSQLKLQQQCQISASDSQNQGITQNHLVKLLTRNNEECWLDCSLRVVQFATKPAILITAVDITKHKEAEQKIKQILEQEKKLISMISHELKTPLNLISFASNLLNTYGDRWKPGKVKQHLERLQRGVDTISLLIDEWLILGKADIGKLKLEPQSFNLEKFCRNLLSDLQLGDDPSDTLRDRHPQQINFFYQGDGSSVNLDRRILQLILTNLLENAIKYSPNQGDVDFTVVCQPEQLIFQIKDRGIGITQSDLEQLFKPFYRGKNVDNIPGHGLGLAVVKKLVELSNGQINVKSQLGIGTEFIISIPKQEKS
ncbi:MAG: ATP-binding protein [Waterburya sp.]